jgi:hypothetical protein
MVRESRAGESSFDAFVSAWDGRQLDHPGEL